VIILVFNFGFYFFFVVCVPVFFLDVLRFQISEADADTCLDGGFVEMTNEGKRDRELANEVAAEIATKGIRPFTTTRYRRCVSQCPRFVPVHNILLTHFFYCSPHANILGVSKEH
jgi:hypothetical protein